MEPFALLFESSLVDGAWLGRFENGLRSSGDWLSQCVDCVERTYQTDANARDGFSRIGWALVRLERIQDGLQMYEQDFVRSRMGRWQFHRYLETLLSWEGPERCEMLISEYYRKNSEAVDAWAILGKWHHSQGRKETCRNLLYRELECGRLSPGFMVDLAVLEAQEGHSIEGEILVEAAYRRAESLRNGFSRLGAIRSELEDWIGAANLYDRDLRQGRMTAGWKLQAAVAKSRTGRSAEAAMLVAEAYSEDRGLRGGYARLAAIRAETRDWSGAVELYERDLTLGRMTPAWKLQAAAAMAHVNAYGNATELIQQAYLADDALRDGFCRLALIKSQSAETSMISRNEVAQLYRLDFEAGRISNAFYLRAAKAICMAGDLNSATQIVKRSYEEDSKLTNGFAELAEILLYDGDAEHAIALFREDLRLGRLTGNGRIQFAIALAETGDFEAAEKTILDGYNQDDLASDGLSILAERVEARQHLSTALHWLLMDQGLSRQSPRHGLRIGPLTVRVLNRIDNLLPNVSFCYENDHTLTDGYAAIASRMEVGHPPTAITEMYERELSDGRPSTAGFTSYIRYLCTIERQSDAERTVDRAYSAHHTLHDGYSTIARHLAQRGDTKQSLSFFEKDHMRDRISPSASVDWAIELHRAGHHHKSQQTAAAIPLPDPSRWIAARELPYPSLLKDTDQPEPLHDKRSRDVTVWATVLAARGDTDTLDQYLTDAYHRNPTLRDCYSAAGRTRLKRGDIQGALALLQKDRATRRAHPESLLQLASLLPGHPMEADQIRNRAYESIGSLRRPTDTWLYENKDLHRGETCYILGTGPSLRNVNVDLLRGKIIFATNGAYALPGLECTYFLSVAESFWRQHKKQIENMKCRRLFLPYWLQGSVYPSGPCSWMNAPFPRTTDAAGQVIDTPLEFSLAPWSYVALGGTVISVALQLALALGFRRAVLLGVDHNYRELGFASQSPNGRNFQADSHSNLHYLQDYYRCGTFHCDLSAIERSYALSRDAFERSGGRVINATHGTHLEIFPTERLENIADHQ